MNLFSILRMLVVFGMCLYLTSTSWAQIDAVTKARDDRSLAFLQGGKVVEIPVKPGSLVKANDVLMILEDKKGESDIRILEMRIQLDVTIEAAKAQRDLAQVNLDQTQQMWEADAANDLELRNRKVEFKIAELELQQRQLDLQEAQLRLKEAKEIHSRYTLRAPINGVIQRVKEGEEVAVGEIVQPGAPVVRLVAVETLTIDAHVPVTDTLDLKVGHKAYIKAKVAPRDRLIDGTVQHIAKVVDPASGTKLIRINVPNENDYLGAGWQVSVYLSNPQTAAKSGTNMKRLTQLVGVVTGKNR